MANPLIQQGTLNRLRGSVTFNDNPSLNVVASNLGEEGIRLALDGPATTFINTLTGRVTSPEPYQPITLTLNLLKTQALADVYKRQQETNTLLGDATFRPDAATLSPYPLVNCGIAGVAEIVVTGKDPIYRVTIGGYYIINSQLWN